MFNQTSFVELLHLGQAPKIIMGADFVGWILFFLPIQECQNAEEISTVICIVFHGNRTDLLK